MCKNVVTRTKVTFFCVPSHVSVPLTEEADALPRRAIEKDEVDVPRQLSMKQIMAIVMKEQYCAASSRMVRQHGSGNALRHCAKARDDAVVSVEKRVQEVM